MRYLFYAAIIAALAAAAVLCRNLGKPESAEKAFFASDTALVKNLEADIATEKALEKYNAVLSLSEMPLKYSLFLRGGVAVKSREFSQKEKSAFLMAISRLKIRASKLVGSTVLERESGSTKRQVIITPSHFGEFMAVEAPNGETLFLICFLSNTAQFVNPRDESILGEEYLKNYDPGHAEYLKEILGGVKNFNPEFQEKFAEQWASFYSPELKYFIENLKKGNGQ